MKFKAARDFCSALKVELKAINNAIVDVKLCSASDLTENCAVSSLCKGDDEYLWTIDCKIVTDNPTESPTLSPTETLVYYKSPTTSVPIIFPSLPTVTSSVTPSVASLFSTTMSTVEPLQDVGTDKGMSNTHTHTHTLSLSLSLAQYVHAMNQ